MTLLLNSMYEVFLAIYSTGILLWDFFSTPIVEENDALGSLDFLVGKTPIELLIGSSLIFVLVYWLYKFIKL